MKVTKLQLIKINNTLFEVSDLKGVKFAYSISKNKKKLEEEMKALSDMQKPSEGFVEYEKQLRKLVEKCGKRDENNNLIKQVNERGEVGFAIHEDDLIFQKEKEILDNKFKNAIEERNKTQEKIQEILEEEIEIEEFEFHKITFNDLPTDLTANQIDLLDFMILQ